VKEFARRKRSGHTAATTLGRGGVEVGAAGGADLAWRFGDMQLAVRVLVGPRSRLVWHRRVLERARSIAPFLNFAVATLSVLRDNGRVYGCWTRSPPAMPTLTAQPHDGDGGVNRARRSQSQRGRLRRFPSSPVQFNAADERDPFTFDVTRALSLRCPSLRSMPTDQRRTGAIRGVTGRSTRAL
jgi:hypothetical protein